MEVLIAKQEDTIDNIKKATANYKKSPIERITLPYIETRLENLEKLWLYFCTVHDKILDCAPVEKRKDVVYFKDDVYNYAEEIYFEYKTKLNSDRVKLTSHVPVVTTTSANNQSNSVNCEVKLPQIKLPSFSGKYEEWETYYDMFLSLIHNNQSLSGVQKLHYLKSSLCGEPANLIKDLATTENNYAEAWSQLVRRYKNKRYNTNEILKKLFAQRLLTSESATAIKCLLDTTNSCLKALNNIGVDTKTWDVIIIHIVTSKLDSESRKAWESEVNSASLDQLPTWNQMILFLERRFRTNEMIDTQPPRVVEQKRKPLPMKSKSLHAVTVPSETNNSKPETNNSKLVICTMCAEKHHIYHCQQFQKLSPKERADYVQNNNICFNCLTPNHAVKFCRKYSNCRRCGRRHHTLLHYENRDALTESISTEPVTHEKRESELERVDQRMTAHFASEKESHQEVLLATAIVNAMSSNGNRHKIRALIDQGSEASFVTEATVQLLGLKKVPVNGVVSGVGDGHMRTKHMVILTIESIQNPEFTIQVRAFRRPPRIIR